MDSKILIAITSTLAVIAAILIGVSVGMEELIYPMFAVVCILAVLVIAKPEITAFLTVSLFASHLNSPGLPGQFGLFEVAAMSVIGASVLVVVFTRKIPISFGVAQWLLIGFCVLLFITGFYRGFGLRFMGSNLWGGFAYVKIFLAAALVFAIPIVNMPVAGWRNAILCMGLLSLVPVIADLFNVFGVRLAFINLFVQSSGMLSNEVLALQQGENVDRLVSAGNTAQILLLTLLALTHTRKIFDPRSIWVPLALLGILILSFVSGFRLMTMTLVLVTFLVIWIQRTLTPGRVALGIVGCLVGLAIVYQIADVLPPNMQRAISWLPGIHISQSASIDASATVSWRLDLWQVALGEIQPNFWMGRGLAFPGEQLVRTMINPSSIDWAFIVGAFHNGYLSLLILTGVGGLILGIGFQIAVIWRHWRMERRRWNNPQLHTMHQAFLAMNTALTIVFLTIYGDIGVNFPIYFFYWGILEALCKADEKEPLTFVSPDEEVAPDELAHLE